MIKKIILKTLIAIILISIISVFYFLNAISKPCGEGSKSLLIKPGLGVNEISIKLNEAGVVCDKLSFETYLWLFKNEGKIKAGEYFFSKPINIKELTKVLIKGQKSGEEVEIKLIEGWNAVEMAEYLEKENIAEKKFFLEAVEDVKSFKEDFQFLSSIPSDKNLEGFLFPDTYRIYNNSEVEDIIRKMLKNFDKKLTQELRDEIQKQEKDLYEILTMASVIQKEVRSTKDMKVVSGIFWDRIKYGQPLESCATIGYILGESKIRYSFEDTKIDSPYNTYTNKGLPPGPIANPGLQAIEAAVYPEFTDYVYFLSKPNGETVFSITYEEHLSNSNKYLK
ncbi:endolytic transglycosylase MltG [Candidatus Falkowbacteria bacterium]|jgi:UPF0755 protein|nr:endolytic transglycosylase MltG [Candidatus Falkowbacteria bacterium]MBT4433393.1 endolytic transglycosylase MltG [Candidatus Falkowbacteria bacterium]